MRNISFNRKREKLKQLLGIRARLALLALMVVAPLMLERARSLEETRRREIALAATELTKLAQNSADAQRQAISSVETVLKSAAFIRGESYGTRASTVVAIGNDGRGVIIERRFGPHGRFDGETRLPIGGPRQR